MFSRYLELERPNQRNSQSAVSVTILNIGLNEDLCIFAPVPCRASIRSEQLIYSSQFHVTSDLLARSFACSTVFQVSILLMADNRVQLLVSQAVPAALSRFWFNVLLHFRRPKNLSYWYLFLYLRLLSPSC